MTWAIVFGANHDFTNSLALTVTDLNKFARLISNCYFLDSEKQIKRRIYLLFVIWILKKDRDIYLLFAL